MGIGAVPCPGHRRCVDIVDSRWPEGDPLHRASAEWQEWVDAIKAGKLDEVPRAAESGPVRHPGQVRVTLCVLLWARPGTQAGLVSYEDQVLSLVPGHGGRVVQRARGSGTDGQPLEIQFLEFPSAAALDAYMADDRRTALGAERDRVIARTEVIRVELVADPG